MSRPSAQQSQNLNNFMGDRSSSRVAKPPGGGSTVGSLIYGSETNGNSYIDERKGRRNLRPEQMGSLVLGGNNEGIVRHEIGEKDAKYQLQQQQYMQQQVERKNNNQSASDIFLQNAPSNIAGERRTRRMYNHGQSTGFQLS
ncbi:hypothetical protein THRCLA_21527 [Thraustotheca clavata]|uniref:Uncharacterized protein n=1 Tax=Thraustotheca clavata TaxID=74557 RepID=A0A1V9ZVJ1_9STRA|nr:hypothetical protein THRCLA_21527 [Thraustotheca clavata]